MRVRSFMSLCGAIASVCLWACGPEDESWKQDNRDNVNTNTNTGSGSTGTNCADRDAIAVLIDKCTKLYTSPNQSEAQCEAACVYYINAYCTSADYCSVWKTTCQNIVDLSSNGTNDCRYCSTKPPAC